MKLGKNEMNNPMESIRAEEINEQQKGMVSIMTIPKLYTIQQAAKLIDGANEKLIRKMCTDGRIDCTMSGNKTLMTIEALYAGFKIPATYCHA